MRPISAGKPRATIIDIAALAGVSKSTVSLVLKGSGLVKAATRERVLTAMRTSGYVYNRGAANLRLARTNIVGMIISDLMNPFFTELAVGIEEALYDAGCVALLANSGEDPERQTKVLRSMSEQGVAGIVISPTNRSDAAALTELARAGIPIVTTMRRLEESGLPYLGQDNQAGERRAVEHLIGLGHRRIAFLGGGHSTMATQRERVAGYREALAAHGVAFDAALVVESYPSRLGGSEAARAVRRLPDPPTAAVCFNDLVAIGAIQELTRQGLRVPQDFVVGFDDIAEAQHNAPPLTTVTAHTKRLGAQAAQLLLDVIAGAPVPSAPVFGETRLVVRQTCAPAAGARRRLSA